MTGYSKERADNEARELRKLVLDQCERFDEIIEAQQRVIGEFIEKARSEAVALHNKYCKNPPGSSCEVGYLEIHKQAWLVERGLARFATPEEVEEMETLEKDEERRYV